MPITIIGRWHLLCSIWRYENKQPTEIDVSVLARMKACSPLRQTGFTLAEVMLATSILAVGFAGLWSALGQCLRISRAHLETIAATECLTQRVEQTRAAGWSAVLTASGISGAVLNLPAANAAALPNLQEQITVAPYPPLTPEPPPIVVTRSAGGTVTVLSQPPSGFDLRATLAVRVDFSLNYQDHQNGRQHTRQESTIIALGGLLQ
jgi:prepilin-type N-terminal cleavage/methylation domain-containing protein